MKQPFKKKQWNKLRRNKKNKNLVPKTDRNLSMSSAGGTIPVPLEAKTSLQVSKSFWTGGIFFWRRRFLLDLLLVIVSFGNSQKSLPFLSAKVLSIPIQYKTKNLSTLFTNWKIQCIKLNFSTKGIQKIIQISKLTRPIKISKTEETGELD